MNVFANAFVNISATGSHAGRARGSAILPISRNVLLGAVTLLSSCAVWAAARPMDDDVSAGPAKASDARAVRLSSVDGQVRVVQDGQVIADPASFEKLMELVDQSIAIRGDFFSYSLLEEEDL